MEIALQFGDFPLGNDNRGKENSTLGLAAYRHVRSRLLEGSLVPGTKLTLRAVADELEMSVQPVREAINRLIAEAALEAVSSRIIQVPVLPRETVDELWSIRILLDGEIAALFARNASPEERAMLRAAGDDLHGFDFGNIREGLVSAYNWSALIGSGSRSPALAALAMNLRLRTSPHVAEALSMKKPFDPAFLEFSTRIMRELNDAMRLRDESRARDLRRADAATYQHFLYDRLDWNLDPDASGPS